VSGLVEFVQYPNTCTVSIVRDTLDEAIIDFKAFGEMS
jgi:hypothetical protein